MMDRYRIEVDDDVYYFNTDNFSHDIIYNEIKKQTLNDVKIYGCAFDNTPELDKKYENI